MRRLAGFASFATIVGVLWILLRTSHLVIPLYYPEVLRGPFSLDDPAQVEEFAAFSPLLPFFRPETLGERPINITVHREPRTSVIFFWQADRFLYLEEAPSAQAPLDLPPDAAMLSSSVDAYIWQRGKTAHVAARIDGIVVRLKTDLSEADAGRIVRTLRPYDELR